jgi:hypothetical protein
MIERAQLAELVQGLEPEMADAIKSGTAILTERPLPFDATAVRVLINEPWGERAAFFGVANGAAVLLSGHPEAFVNLAHSAGASVTDAEGAVEFALALLDTSRAFDQPEYRVDSAAEVQMRPPLGDEEKEAKDRFLADHGNDIKPATAVVGPGGGFEVTLYRVRAGQVERVVVSVGKDGSATVSTDALEPTPPLPVSL